MSKPLVLIRVVGGIVQAVLSSRDIEVLLLDEDFLEAQCNSVEDLEEFMEEHPSNKLSETEIRFYFQREVLNASKNIIRRNE